MQFTLFNGKVSQSNHWTMVQFKDSAIAFCNSDGYVLSKKYNSSFRCVAGKWVLYDPQSMCIGRVNFFNQKISSPPFEWAEEKMKDQKLLEAYF